MEGHRQSREQGRGAYFFRKKGGFGSTLNIQRASQVAQMIKRLPAMRATQVQSLAWEDPVEKEMVTHSSTLAWKIPWTEEPCRL